MNARCLFSRLCLSVLSLATASPAFCLANRVFVSARSGNDANSCDNIATPCQTFAGAIAQLNSGGAAIVLDSGGYGAVTVTKGLTLEAPPGVTAFIHPSSGNAITINASVSDTVVLRGLVLNAGSGMGIMVNTVGKLSIENCAISGFSSGAGVYVVSAGQLFVKNTDVKFCNVGVEIHGSSGTVKAAIDHCHLDANGNGFVAVSTSPGGSMTVATNSTANSNIFGWVLGSGSTGKDVLDLEFCTGSENSADGLVGLSNNAQSVARYSNCVFADNESLGVDQLGAEIFQTRGNNTITGNGSGATFGTIGTFPPM